LLVKMFEFLITIISSCVNWAFNLVINDSPRITLGVFLISCAFIGFVVYFLFNTDFFLPFVSNGAEKIRGSNSKSNSNPKVVYHVHTSVNSKKGGK